MIFPVSTVGGRGSIKDGQIGELEEVQGLLAW
jgi:hypothetical protein